MQLYDFGMNSNFASHFYYNTKKPGKMKKQIKKLSLNKKTISNLTSAEMNTQVGGGLTGGCTKGNKYTCGHTCLGRRTCFPCW